MTPPAATSSSARAAPGRLPPAAGPAPDLWAELFQHAPAGYCTLDPEGRIREANATLATMLGTAPGALRGRLFARMVCPADGNLFKCCRGNLSAAGPPQSCDLRLEQADGALLWVHLAAAAVPGNEGPPECRLILCDIHRHHLAEQSLRNLYIVLAQVNQALVNYRERNDLFRAVCRIAVQQGGFRLAWIGLVDEATGQLKPVAHAGYEAGYLQAIHVNVNPGSAFSQGPSGQAVLRNQVVVNPDFATAPRVSPWREEALKRGYRSSVAVPFRLEEKVVGALNLYGATPMASTGEEQDLLGRLGGALSFALQCFAVEQDRQRAEAALRESEARNRAFIHAIPDLIFLNTRDGEYLAVHAPDPGLLAAPVETVLHRRIGDLLPKPIAARCLRAIAAALDTRALRKLTYTLVLDGRPRRFEARVAPCTPDSALTIVRDITDLKPGPQTRAGRKPRRRPPPAGP